MALRCAVPHYLLLAASSKGAGSGHSPVQLRRGTLSPTTSHHLTPPPASPCSICLQVSLLVKYGGQGIAPQPLPTTVDMALRLLKIALRTNALYKRVHAGAALC